MLRNMLKGRGKNIFASHFRFMAEASVIPVLAMTTYKSGNG